MSRLGAELRTYQSLAEKLSKECGILRLQLDEKTTSDAHETAGGEEPRQAVEGDGRKEATVVYEKLTEVIEHNQQMSQCERKLTVDEALAGSVCKFIRCRL